MKKYFFIALLCAAQFVWAAVSPTVTLTSYYASADGKSGETLRSALSAKIRPHTTVSYDALKYLFKWTDTYNNAGTTIDDIYSFCDPAYTESWCAGTCGYNREHSVPKSWFGEASPLYSDAFHLYPTNCYVNSYRGNEPFGECANGTKCTTNGVQAKGRKGASTFPGHSVSGVVYEPDDEFKGDLARTYFYMVTCYMSSNFTQAEGGRTMFTYANGTAQLSNYSVDLLLKWHRQDPVSERELARNEVIYGNETLNKCSYKQGNRNPFIDYPELAEYIWGNKKGQSVSLSSLVSPYNGGTPTTPPQPADTRYGVTWSVNGKSLRTDSVSEDSQIVEMPAEPTSCSAESTEFVGWTDAPIDGEQDEAPETLYTAAKDFPAVTGDATYYAVFAKKTVTESQGVPTQEAFDFTAMGLKDKQVISSPFRQGDATITFEKAGAGTAPTYYTGALRLYAGGTMTVTAQQMTKIVLTYGASDKSNAITASVGSFDTDTWTGSADEVVFTVGDTSGHRKIATATVTLNGSGTLTTYNRFITSCRTATELTTLPADDATARKVLVGGHIFILVGDRLFTPAGQRVR